MRRHTVALAAGALLLAACSSEATAPTTTPAATATTGAASTSVATTEAPTTQPTSTLPPTTSTTPLAEGSVAFTPYLTGLNKPVEMATRDYQTWYLVQQDGLVLPIVDDASGASVGAPVLDLRAKVSTGGEQGLLGLAFHPTEPFVYADYTNTDGDTVVAEFAVGADGSIDAASERTVLMVDQPYPNHNGGKIDFSADRMLYIALGDGGAADDPERHGQDLGSLLGKILRIDPLAADGKPYTVPADNPFVGTAGAQPEIWSYGLRNPWRFAFDPGSDDLWIADVGQNLWEEVDYSPATAGAGKGVNFGWSAMEASHPFNADQTVTDAVDPIWEYAHGDDGCSVSGGAVYTGSRVASLQRWFVVADYCSGKVWALQADHTTGALTGEVQLGTVDGNPGVVAVGPGAEVYVLGVANGTVYRIDPA